MSARRMVMAFEPTDVPRAGREVWILEDTILQSLVAAMFRHVMVVAARVLMVEFVPLDTSFAPREKASRKAMRPPTPTKPKARVSVETMTSIKGELRFLLLRPSRVFLREGLDDERNGLVGWRDTESESEKED